MSISHLSTKRSTVPVVNAAQDPNTMVTPEQKRPRVPIYRSKRAPSWLQQQQQQPPDLENDETIEYSVKMTKAPEIHAKKGHIRLAVSSSSSNNNASQPAGHGQRRKQEAQIISGDTAGDSSSTDNLAPRIDTSALTVPAILEAPAEEEDEVAARRARVRERLTKKRQEEGKQEEQAAKEVALASETENKGGDGSHEGDEAERSESEYETEESEEEFGFPRPMVKPVFVSKKDRATIDERERLEQAEIEAEEMQQKRNQERKEESLQLVVDMLKQEAENANTKAAEEEELPDDRDDVNEDEEFQQWKLRELRRIKREREEQEQYEKEKEDLERRRNMTDKEIKNEQQRDGEIKEKTKGQYRFLQKYYHKGAYFQHLESDALKRDFTVATGLDAEFDKAVMPTVLQVKKFGLKGRTKYTHLTDQDTTRFDDNPWIEAVGKTGHLAGTGAVMAKKPKKDKS